MLTPKQYYDDAGGLIFVSVRVGKVDRKRRWMSFRKRTTLSGVNRLSSPALPIRANREDAQSDLDGYALEKGWDIAE
jgi:hypothetical protein